MFADLYKKEEEVKEQERENAKLTANALAAKAASKMKSQFLANVSYLAAGTASRLSLPFTLDVARDPYAHRRSHRNE